MSAVATELDAFRAVADPTRRALLDLLAGAERSVTELVAHFEMSQPAVSQHLRVLVDAGLAAVRRAGRRRYYRAQAAPLRAIHDWAGHYEHFWNEGLDRLGAFLDEQAAREAATARAAAPGPRPPLRRRLRLDLVENLDLEARR